MQGGEYTPPFIFYTQLLEHILIKSGSNFLFIKRQNTAGPSGVKVGKTTRYLSLLHASVKGPIMKEKYLIPCIILVGCLCTFAQTGQWINISDELCTQLGVMDKPFKANKQTAGVFVDPRNGDVYMTVCSKGIYRSSDFGSSWSKWSPAGMNGRGEKGFSHNIHYPYTGRIAIFHIDGDCGYTLDNGATWNTFTSVQRNWDIGDLDWSSPNPQTVVTILHESTPFYSAQISTDAGNRFSVMDETNNKRNCFGVVNSTSLVRSLYGTDGIEFSSDKGKSWTRVSDFSPLGRIPVHYGSKLYWATKEGVIVSSDGKDWSLKGTSLADATWGPYFGNTENQMMVVTPDGFYITEDGCNTWIHALPWHTMADGWGTGAYNDIAQYIHFGWDPVNNIIYQSVLAGSTQKYRLNWSLSSDPSNPGPDDFVQIFDGKTFEGWDIQYIFDKPETKPPINIVDGCIRVENTSHPNQGWVRYNKATYKNFVLKFEGRYLTSGANSGIFFRAYSKGKWVTPGYEVNFRHSSELPGSGKANLELYGPEGKYPLLPATYSDFQNGGLGEWTEFVITVNENNITVDYNGQKNCVTFDGLTLPEGYIGFQSETGVFEYRNIYLKPLSGEVIPVNYSISTEARNGTVTKDPEKTSYSSGVKVTLIASTSAGYTFSKWTGDTAYLSSSTSASTTLTMPSRNISLTANFISLEPVPRTLNVSVVGNGSVSKSPDKETYSEGETVTLTGIPAQGHYLASWSGDASGRLGEIEVVMDTDKNITATFLDGDPGSGYRYLKFEVISVHDPDGIMNINIDWIEGTESIAHEEIGYQNTLPYSITTDLGAALATPTAIQINTNHNEIKTPKEFNCYGSEDGEVWIPLHSQISTIGYSPNESTVFHFGFTTGSAEHASLIKREPSINVHSAVNGLVNLQFSGYKENERATITLTGLNGAVVFRGEIGIRPQVKLRLKETAPGLYLLNVETKRSFESRKMIINH